MSADLVWQLIRDNNAYIVKRAGTKFSTEPNNLLSKHSPKFSGLANKETVGVDAVDHKTAKGKIVKRVAVTTLRPRKSNVPKAVSSKMVLSGVKRKGSAKAAIKSATSKSFYRGDLTKFAVARYHALSKAIAIKKTKKA